MWEVRVNPGSLIIAPTLMMILYLFKPFSAKSVWFPLSGELLILNFIEFYCIWLAVSCKPQMIDIRTDICDLLFPCADPKLLGPDVFKDAGNFSTFLLDRSSGLLYVGAKDAILSVDTNRMSQEPQKVSISVASSRRSFWSVWNFSWPPGLLTHLS